MNNWILAVIAWMILEALICVGRVGKPRKPISSSDAVLQVCSWSLMIALILVGVS